MKLIILILLVLSIKCYIQLKIDRHELNQQLKNYGRVCITKEMDEQITKKQRQQVQYQKDTNEDREDKSDQIQDEEIDDDQNYKEVCYEKDIAYAMEISYEHQTMLVSVDTTIPISWIKGKKCHIEGYHKKCRLVKQTMKEKITKLVSKDKAKSSPHSKSQYAMIEGSSELVKGIQERIQNFKFIMKDSSIFNKMLELLLLGFYLREEHEIFVLKQTNLINATEISQNLNYLVDGAISFRFDKMSENSFLKEMFEYQDNAQEIVSIYLAQDSGYLTVGNISTKYSKFGYGGLQWVSVSPDEYYGQLPVISNFIIDSENDNAYFEVKDKQYPAFFSLSASYIGLPQLLFNTWIEKLGKKMGCKINNTTKYMECSKLKEKDLRKTLTFVIDSQKMSIPLNKLVLKTTKNSTLLNIKQTAYQNYTIMGEPIFFEYFIVFDYKNNKLGFAEKAENPHFQAINLVMLIRVVTFIFLAGCVFILCYIPVQKCINLVGNRRYYSELATNIRSVEGRRLKASHSDYDAFESLSGQIKSAFEDEKGEDEKGDDKKGEDEKGDDEDNEKGNNQNEDD